MINGTRLLSTTRHLDNPNITKRRPLRFRIYYNESCAAQHRRVYRSPKTQGRKRKTNPTVYYPSTGFIRSRQVVAIAQSWVRSIMSVQK